MGKNYTDNNLHTKTNSAYAISSPALNYGRIITLPREEIWPKVAKRSLKGFLKFYYGELLTGIVFISVLLLYTLLMPEGVRNPLKLFGVMIDKILKKVLDVGGAIIGLILALPIFVVIPILLKLTSPGSIFYVQERIGIDRRRRERRIFRADVASDNRHRERRRQNSYGRPFRVVKFRTMIHNAETDSGPVWAKNNDSRVTKLGRLLRKSRIDEVPQLVNVLVGDMSLVGPRPERLFFIKDLSRKIPGYLTRLKVKPGITGRAQVNRGYDSSLESVIEKVEEDVKYIRSWSIFSDLKILAKTVLVVITGRGAF
jgi:lipopolysaccharide/colanic/teichoic acid biosynthesis glycosyltransferase